MIFGQRRAEELGATETEESVARFEMADRVNLPTVAFHVRPGAARGSMKSRPESH